MKAVFLANITCLAKKTMIQFINKKIEINKKKHVSGHWHHKSYRMAEEKCILCDMRVSLSEEAQIIFFDGPATSVGAQE